MVMINNLVLNTFAYAPSTSLIVGHDNWCEDKSIEGNTL